MMKTTRTRKYLSFFVALLLRFLLLVDTLFPSAYLYSQALISISPYNNIINSNNNINIASAQTRWRKEHSNRRFPPTIPFSGDDTAVIAAATTTSLFASNDDEGNSKSNNNNNNNEKGETQRDLKRRMAVVRSLQSSFYKSSSEGGEMDHEHPNLERETGMLLNLPVWRVQWWEVPGRSNVLNVHEPIYTNMFESVLRGPKPWCFGHLYLQGGSRNLNSKKDSFQLESWENTTTPTTSHKDQSSAVVGCLMNIADCRRMADGRLLLLVHAMERFVVTDVLQKVPYGIVNAQVLPDLEEMDPDLNVSNGHELESQLKYPRAMAIQESVRFHDYEYDRDHKLPVPNNDDLQDKDILQSDLAKVLPFAPFSKTLEPPQESTLTTRNNAIDEDGEDESVDPLSGDDDDEDDEPSLEYRLLSEGVLQTAEVTSSLSSSSPESFSNNNDSSREQQRTHGVTTDELEYDLWLAINNFLIKTRTPVSPVLLGLLPKYNKADDVSSTDDNDETPVWPKRFVLKQIVKELNELDTVDHDFVWVPRDYPAYRRQRRLAYSAASLLETDTDATNELRPRLLAAPSTHERLRLVLEGFDHWQQEQWGAFE